MNRKGSSTRRRRKSGKYTPLIWVITISVILFFIFNSGNIKGFIDNYVSKPATNQIKATNNAPAFDIIKFFIDNSKNNVSSSGSNISPSVLSSSLSLQAVSSSGSSSSMAASMDNKRSVRIYLAEQSGNTASLVYRNVNVTDNENLLLNTLNSLFDYRNDPNLLNLIPINTKINKLWIKNTILYLDLNEDFTFNSYGELGYNIQIYQIVYTALQFQEIKAVHFYKNGASLDYLGGDGYLLHNPIYPFSSLPKFNF